ncbi:PA2G4 [Symbiodinium sp. KB8]|nr:PA2G4 [Symbiodinium sp. KB8]
MGRVAEAYGVTPVQGTLMHQMKQYIIDGNKVILLRGDDPEQKADEEEFATHDVFAVDVAFSTGAGKPKASSARTTVFKRAHENHFGLKMKASKWLLGNVMSKSPYMPFTLRAFGDERQARLGVTECVNHDVFYEYPVLEEEEGKVVAQFKFTVLVTPNGPQIVTGLPLPEGMAVEGVTLPEDLAAIRAEELHTSGGGKKKRRRKKKGGAKAAEAAEE